MPSTMTSLPENLAPPSATATRMGGKPSVHFVRGRGEVLRLSPQLRDFGARCGQSGAMHDMAYFLSKPGALPRIPHLLLVSRAGELDVNNLNHNDLLGALLIFEQQISGFGVGAFATNDRSGRSTLIAMPSDRSMVAAMSSRALLDRGAHLILMSFRAEGAGGPLAEATVPLVAATEGKAVARWARRERSVPEYLPLAATFDATVAKIGQRTRSNLRYYRRRAESVLGCRFVPQVDVSREEVLAFNRECMYAATPDVIGYRYDSLQELSEPIFMGIKHGDGRWLSMLGGRRYLDRSEILWQLNREGFPTDSLGTVMRSYFMEHEIAHGSRRMYIEGGTPHPIKFSFMQEVLTDLVVVRRTLTATVMRMVARRYISRDNELSHMLGAKDLDWLPC
jgi:hypothetical protein